MKHYLGKGLLDDGAKPRPISQIANLETDVSRNCGSLEQVGSSLGREHIAGNFCAQPL
jgi:hypothetical protein